MIRRLLVMGLAVTLMGCGENSWKSVGTVATGLAVAALASASGGSLGQSGAFDPERYDEGRDARYKQEVQRRLNR